MEIVTQIATFLNHVCAALFDAQIWFLQYRWKSANKF